MCAPCTYASAVPDPVPPSTQCRYVERAPPCSLPFLPAPVHAAASKKKGGKQG